MKPDSVVDFDAALIERARRGDSKAFERLYREHVGRVHGLCLRMTRNPDQAADCVQDAFIKAWKALPKFEARSMSAESKSTTVAALPSSAVVIRIAEPSAKRLSLVCTLEGLRLSWV